MTQKHMGYKTDKTHFILIKTCQTEFKFSFWKALPLLFIPHASFPTPPCWNSLFSYVCLKACWPFNKRKINLFLNWLNSTNIPTRSLIKKSPVFMASVGMERILRYQRKQNSTVSLTSSQAMTTKSSELIYHITLICRDL